MLPVCGAILRYRPSAQAREVRVGHHDIEAEYGEAPAMPHPHGPSDYWRHDRTPENASSGAARRLEWKELVM
jgi:hypothetical protein